MNSLKILAIPGARVAKREEYLAGIAVFKEGQRLLMRTGKGELLLRSGNDIDQYISERALRGSKLPRGHQEVKEIEKFNNKMRHLKPDDEGSKKWLESEKKKLGRDDYFSYFDNLDADEKRF